MHLYSVRFLFDKGYIYLVNIVNNYRDKIRILFIPIMDEKNVRDIHTINSEFANSTRGKDFGFSILDNVVESISSFC